jgi:hypothetical protein
MEENLSKNEINKKINKGTGAGGSNTNYFGKKFEEKTDNESKLLEMGYKINILDKKIKQSSNKYYMSKLFDDKTIIFVTQSGLKTYIKHKYNIDLWRYPDEAYIIEYNTGKKIIKILEKKEQNVDGSVETKLWSAIALKREYELALENKFEVHYGFCVSDFLKKKITSTEKKYITLNIIFNENNISLLFGDDENYFEMLNNWINFGI